MITVVHMFTTTALAGGTRWARKRFWGLPVPSVPWKDVRRCAAQTHAHATRDGPRWRFPRLELHAGAKTAAARPATLQMLYSISPAGVTGALDIGLSNLSLDLISITLYTMCKSTVVAWLLMSAFVFKLEKPSVPLVMVVAMISGGLILFRAKEGISFHSIGFFLVMSAAAMGGLRWVLTQLILHKEKDRLGLKASKPLYERPLHLPLLSAAVDPSGVTRIVCIGCAGVRLRKLTSACGLPRGGSTQWTPCTMSLPAWRSRCFRLRCSWKDPTSQAAPCCFTAPSTSS